MQLDGNQVDNDEDEDDEVEKTKITFPFFSAYFLHRLISFSSKLF